MSCELDFSRGLSDSNLVENWIIKKQHIKQNASLNQSFLNFSGFLKRMRKNRSWSRLRGYVSFTRGSTLTINTSLGGGEDSLVSEVLSHLAPQPQEETEGA